MGRTASRVIAALVLFLPWPVRRRVLERVFGYSLHPSSHIGVAWVYPENLVLCAHARIGHLTVCKGLQRVTLEPFATIGRLNWITGFPASADGTGHFAGELDRKPELIVREHAAITNRHIVDCTNSVTIGRFSTVAGFRTQILTHSVVLAASRQGSRPVLIGEYCFVGTASVLLPGSSLPSHSVLGAGSVLTCAQTEPYHLYSGVPARPVRALAPDLAYFSRLEGYVH